MSDLSTSGFRPEFIGALALLARASDAVVSAGFGRPVLVGGASVEFYTAGAITSGDFDLVTSAQRAVEVALIDVGFRKEDRPGHLLRGLYHPTLRIGVEIVSGSLFDGRTDRTRLLMVDIDGHTLALPPVEDLIADRMGQYASDERGRTDMLQQAMALFRLVDGTDGAYLERRIREETVNQFGLSDLRRKIEDDAEDDP